LTPLSRQDAPVLCWTWDRPPGDQKPQTVVIAGRHLPIPPSALGSGINQVQGTATVYTNGGKYVQVQSDDPRYGESLYYVDPLGVRYGLPDQETAATLGLSSPTPAPSTRLRESSEQADDDEEVHPERGPRPAPESR
jgi:hypothetical protein